MKKNNSEKIKEPGWFYCMQNRAYPGICKLGKSRDLKHREQTMQHDAPFDRVQKAVWVNDMHEMERKVHKEYKDYKKCIVHKKGIGYELGVKDVLERLTNMLLETDSEHLETSICSLVDELKAELEYDSGNYEELELRGEWYDLRDKDVFDDFAKRYGLIDREFIMDLRGKEEYKYDPEKSVEELAVLNDVSIPTIRKYIQNKRIDRKCDERMLTYNLIWKNYIKNPTVPKAQLARKLHMSVNTIKLYLGLPKPPEPMEGKIGLVEEDIFVASYRMNTGFIDKT